MKFRFAHNNFNVIDLGKSIAFIEALGLKELRARAKDGPFIIVFMTGNRSTPELTGSGTGRFLRFGDCEFHLAFTVDDYEGAHQKHKDGCIAYETRRWESTSLPTPTGTGSRLFHLDLEQPPRYQICLQYMADEAEGGGMAEKKQGTFISDLQKEFAGYNGGKLAKDIVAGLTVAAVALPLALAFAVSCGADAASGIITAIFSGLIIGALGGASFQISGPTGTMAGVLRSSWRIMGMRGFLLLRSSPESSDPCRGLEGRSACFLYPDSRCSRLHRRRSGDHHRHRPDQFLLRDRKRRCHDSGTTFLLYPSRLQHRLAFGALRRVRHRLDAPLAQETQ